MPRVRLLSLLSAGLLLLAARPRSAAALDLRQQPLAVRTWSRPGRMFAVARAPDGMLWFGSGIGLSRFDGERFVDVDLGQVEGPSARWVRRVLVTSDGAVWAATGIGTLELSSTSGAGVAVRHGATVPGLVRLAPLPSHHSP